MQSDVAGQADCPEIRQCAPGAELPGVTAFIRGVEDPGRSHAGFPLLASHSSRSYSATYFLATASGE